MKILVLDFDGVISPGRYFSEIYSEEFGVDINVLLPFFDNIKDSANIGKADLKELLSGVLDDWKWEGTVDELLKYWFNADSDVDDRVRRIAKDLRQKGTKVYLATDQEKYRTEFIWNERGLKNWMDGRFVSYELGYHKNDPRFFDAVIQKLKVSPEEIVFFDDSESKVSTARKAGINAYVYTDFEKFKKAINSTLSERGLKVAY